MLLLQVNEDRGNVVSQLPVDAKFFINAYAGVYDGERPSLSLIASALGSLMPDPSRCAPPITLCQTYHAVRHLSRCARPITLCATYHAVRL